MTWDTTTIILVGLILLGLLIMALGLVAQRKAKAPKPERKLGEDGSPYVASQERPYMTPPPPPPTTTTRACSAPISDRPPRPSR